MINFKPETQHGSNRSNPSLLLLILKNTTGTDLKSSQPLLLLQWKQVQVLQAGNTVTFINAKPKQADCKT